MSSNSAYPANNTSIYLTYLISLGQTEALSTQGSACMCM